jgi:hypothetical protein
MGNIPPPEHPYKGAERKRPSHPGVPDVPVIFSVGKSTPDTGSSRRVSPPYRPRTMFSQKAGKDASAQHVVDRMLAAFPAAEGARTTGGPVVRPPPRRPPGPWRAMNWCSTIPSNLPLQPAPPTCPSNLPLQPAPPTCPSNLPLQPGAIFEQIATRTMAMRCGPGCLRILVADSSILGTLFTRQRCRAAIMKEANMGRGVLLWLIGIPLPIILIVWLLGGLHG